MALLKCPECGKEIRDNAPACPDCGHPITPENSPESSNTNQPAAEEPVQNKQTKNRKKIPILAAILAAAIVGCSAGVYIDNNRKKGIYEAAAENIRQENYKDAIDQLSRIPGFQDADTLLAEAESNYEVVCTYEKAKELIESENYIEALDLLTSIPEYKYTAEATDTIYQAAAAKAENKDFDGAIEIYDALSDYKDAKEQSALLQITKQKFLTLKEAERLVEEYHYSEAEALLDTIEDFEGASDLKARIASDYAFNEYVENMTLFGFYAESGALLSEDLLDHALYVWHNSIHKKSSYLTDSYTQDALGNFYKNPKTALSNYLSSNSHSWAEKSIIACQEKVDELYNTLKNPPAELQGYLEMINELYSTYSSYVDSSLNIKDSYNSAAEDARTKKSEFSSLYSNLKLQLPEKKTILYPETPRKDFLCWDFGMTGDEVIEALKDHYGIEEELSSEFITCDSFELPDGTQVDLVFSFDDFRTLESLWFELPSGTTEEDCRALIKSLYKEDFDGNEYVKCYGKYPELSIWASVRKNQTVLYLDPEEESHLEISEDVLDGFIPTEEDIQDRYGEDLIFEKDYDCVFMGHSASVIFSKSCVTNYKDEMLLNYCITFKEAAPGFYEELLLNFTESAFYVQSHLSKEENSAIFYYNSLENALLEVKNSEDFVSISLTATHEHLFSLLLFDHLPTKDEVISCFGDEYTEVENGIQYKEQFFMNLFCNITYEFVDEKADSIWVELFDWTDAFNELLNTSIENAETDDSIKITKHKTPNGMHITLEEQGEIIEITDDNENGRSVQMKLSLKEMGIGNL